MDKNPQKIFNTALYAQRRARAQRKMGRSFLSPRIIEDVCDRLLDTTRQFDRAVFIGDIRDGEEIRARLPKGKIGDIQFYDLLPGGAYDGEALPVEPQSVDLIINLMTLHHVNDLPGLLIQHRRALKPDGLFIGALFGGQTLSELRSAAYAAEEAIYGGVSPRVSPMADFQQLAGLMQRAGFALPVIDTDRVNVSYKDPMRLLTDLKEMGEMSIMRGRAPHMPSRRFVAAVLGAYAAQFPAQDAGHPASFDILWLTGWAPHERQQKPLKPGSAKMRLADALGAKEQKL